MSKPFKTLAIALICLLAIAVSWTTMVRGLRGPAIIELRQHEGLGQALAEETARVLTNQPTKRIAIVAYDDPDPALQAQIRAFEHHAKTVAHLNIDERVLLERDEKRPSAPGSGLSSRRFAKLVKKHAKLDALVIFAGVPNPESDQLKDLDSAALKIIAVSRQSPERLGQLAKKSLLHLAIVPRFSYPAPGPDKPKTARECFDRHFQVVRLEENARGPDSR